MAECYREPIPRPVLYEVILRLSDEEASTLKQLLSRIGGDPDGPRATIDRITEALRAAGVQEANHKMEVHTGFRGNTYLRIEKGEGE